MSNSTEQVKSKLDIVSVVSTYMTLEKSGINFKGKCPFHNEKTPSFYVSPERNSFYCFGCHAKGDIFTFVQEFEGLDFKSALKMLAERAGVTLDNNSFEKNEDRSELDLIYSALELATFYFQRNLSPQSEPSTYLESRGATPETLNSWQLGFLECRSNYTHPAFHPQPKNPLKNYFCILHLAIPIWA